ncbi:MAG: hypothetical protein KAU21_19140 [Gammaproteobacteria bacterium]|nr:hypothetical protein [Gammaproteobacteria bacterium]
MVTNKKSLGFGTALFIAISMGSVHAEAGDMSQTRTRVEMNLQIPEIEKTQTQIREQNMGQKMVQVKTQARNEYRNNFQLSQRGAASGSMPGQNMVNRSGRGMH